jgi:hypothetical protein
MLMEDSVKRPSCDQLLQKLSSIKKSLIYQEKFLSVSKSNSRELSYLLNDDLRLYFKSFLRINQSSTIHYLLLFEDVLIFKELTTIEEKLEKYMQIYLTYFNESKDETFTKTLKKYALSILSEYAVSPNHLDENIVMDLLKTIVEFLLPDCIQKFEKSQLFMEMKEIDKKSRKKKLTNLKSSHRGSGAVVHTSMKQLIFGKKLPKNYESFQF